MDIMFEAYLAQIVYFEPDEIPQTKEPLWLLGRKYNTIDDIETIHQAILSIPWTTYRRGFPAIGGEHGPTSDRGWGCMLRSAQMVLAQALIRRHLGRDWTWLPETRDSTYLKIMRKFEDSHNEPYSIHQIALMGRSVGTDVGQWFGPNLAAHVLKKLVEADEWSDMKVYVAVDSALYIDNIRTLCTKEEDDVKSWTPLLLIIPLRLGLDDLNSCYIDALKKCFRYQQSLGFVGGKPNVASYFIGYIGDEVIYLDPHRTQKSGSINQKETRDEVDLDMSYHCTRACRTPFQTMAPSLALVFFCETEDEFDGLIKDIQEDHVQQSSDKLFTIENKNFDAEYMTQSISSLKNNMEAMSGNSDDEGDFVLL